MIDSGISTAAILRATVSTNKRKIEPSIVAAGISFVLSGPTNILAKCGITRPIHPIVPLIQTASAVNSVEHIMAISRKKQYQLLAENGLFEK